MAISSIGLAGLPDVAVMNGPASGSAPARESLPGLFGQLLNGVIESDQNADAAVRNLGVGQTDNLHEVMLQMAQSDLQFRLMLEIRNRLTEAYQEVMKMQI
jgi:flagellar hook-basal body complex protein FliE